MRHHRHTVLSLVPSLLLGAVLTLAGCTSEPELSTGTPPAAGDAGAGTTTSAPAGDAPDGAQAADPCSLLSQQQASRLLKKDVEPGKVDQLPSGRTCLYAAANGLQSITVAAMANVATSPDGFRREVQSGLKAFAGKDVPIEDVSGVGDAAFATEDGKSIWFLAGGRAYNVILFYSGSDALKVATDAAKIVVANV